ncbi:MAG: hypothetical protein NT138_12915 [Planctomycetales bacterium]|nr:hypothetical protein [Planctomycetales bacterium]
MLDLVLSAFGMLILCFAFCMAGASLQKRGGGTLTFLALAVVTSGGAAYMLWIWDRPILARILPFSNAIILGNWLPVAAAFFIGVCLKTETIAYLRRVFFATALGCLCGFSLISPLLGDAPECGILDQSGRIFEFQTTKQTCSAACAAGLLRLHGIDATEEELAALCLTRSGTHWLGVFRGLKIKTAGTEWDVIVEEVTPNQLTCSENLPGVLALTFKPEAAENSMESGFGTEVGHTVVCLGTSQKSKTLEVFDPSPDYGFESWNDRILEDVQTGILLRLVSRKGTPSPLHGIDTNRPSTWNDRRMASQ